MPFYPPNLCHLYKPSPLPAERQRCETPQRARSLFRLRHQHVMDRLDSDEQIPPEERLELEESAMKLKRAAQRRKRVILKTGQEPSISRRGTPSGVDRKSRNSK
mmetsp:Transcript_22710/g.56431  ORF Transcript_22710/g.56431 Transcript_22710/m.56431 type:complete len:104 (-) Transcript_22710:620-931(-)